MQDDTILYQDSYENESIIPEFTEIVQFIHGSDKDNQIKRELIKELVDISGKLKNISQLELIDSEFKIEVLRYFYNENLEFANKYLFANEKNLFLDLINANR